MVIRLVDGEEPSRGRIELFWEGEWGTVSDDGWDINDANVACKQLGYQRASSAVHSAYFGEGVGKIWLTRVSCSGNEDSLMECDLRFYASDTQQHNKDAGLVCMGHG